MKLLIITQKVDKNDPILGFFHRWIEEFAKNYEKVTVICLEKGEYNLPENVKVLSLGKEKLKIENSKLKIKFRYILNFYHYIWSEKDNYDAVFVHMNQEYVILGAVIWRMMGKKVYLWYVHRQTNFKLWVSEKLAHKIFTSSPESFLLKSKKVKYLGHGILMRPVCEPLEDHAGGPVLMHIGRITPIKRCELALEALVQLKGQFPNIRLRFVGDPVTTQDQTYLNGLKKFVQEKGLEAYVEFSGNVSPSAVRDELCKADATVNLAPTGGMDKAVLESLSVGVPVFFANNAFVSIVGERSSDFHIDSQTSEVLVEKIGKYFSSPNNGDIRTITEGVRERFSIPALMSRILENL